MTLRHTLPALVAAALFSGGCLLKDVSETWYIAEDGAVTWTVIEKDVRSDAKSAVDRQNEEMGYYEAVVKEDHPIARGFRATGAADIRTRVLRGELPYTVVTEGRFTGLDVLGQRLIAATDLEGTSAIVRDGDAWEWTFSVRDADTPEGDPSANDDADALLNDMDTWQAVLAGGRFESAQGFTLSSDKRVATFDENQFKDAADDVVIVLKLRWTTR